MGDMESSGYSPDGAELRRLMEGLEGTSVEFKSSLRYDLATGEVNKALTKAVIKTLAGFLNVSGGTLIIGVSDDRQVVGIEHDLETLSRKNLDSFEMTLRNAVATQLGVQVGPLLSVNFVDFEGKTVARVECPANSDPIFLSEGDRYEFYIRDGNQTRPLNVRDTHEYIHAHWPGTGTAREDVREVVADMLREQLPGIVQGVFREAVVTHAPPPVLGEAYPVWLKMSTRRVLDLFLAPLARSPGWKRLYVISPWISDIEHSASLTSEQFLSRLTADRATVYVVTRPPVHEWHIRAVERLAATGRVNVALVPELHIKLYTAMTTRGSFAMLGSANFTQQALVSREIGLLVNSYSDGKKLVSELHYEAAQIYRLPERKLLYRASLRLTLQEGILGHYAVVVRTQRGAQGLLDRN
jgi:hypothetical protein